MDWSLKSACRVPKIENTPSDSFYVHISDMIKGKVGNLHSTKLKVNLHNTNPPKSWESYSELV